MQMINGNRHVANSMIYYKGSHYMTSCLNNNLYKAGTQYLTNDGEPIRRARVCRMLSTPAYERVRIARLQIDMLQGVGLDSIVEPTPGFDPKVYLSLSEDGGITYRDLGTADIGKIGRHLVRTIFRNIGAHYDTIVQLEIFDPVKVYILGGAIYFAINKE